MNGFVNLALALVVLTWCSTGQALECYNCGFTSEKCTTTTVCTGSDNACMKLTETGTKQNRTGCRALSRCNIQAVKDDFQLTNFNIDCCQKDLCNRSPLAIPVAALVLGLSTALVMAFSW